MNKLAYKIRAVFNRVSAIERAEYVKQNNLVTIGEGCEIYSNVNFGSEPYLIKLGNKVRITAGTKFITHDGGMWVIRNLGWNKNADYVKPIIIGDNVMIGINSIIMPGVTIGSNVVIGAGSIVTRDIPDNSVAVGSPARVICSIDEYYSKNKDNIYETKQMNYDEKREYYLKKFNLQ